MFEPLRSLVVLNETKRELYTVAASVALVKISLDEIQPRNKDSDKDGTDDVTHTPLRKRRVSMSAMTALRFSMGRAVRRHQQMDGSAGRGVPPTMDMILWEGAEQWPPQNASAK